MGEDLETEKLRIMGSLKMMLVVVMAMVTAVMGGVVYKVGDDAGWTNIGHVDYKTWAATKLFQVGDTILFRYDKEFHNVVRVTYHNFVTCNGTTPYNTLTSGNDSFPIKFPGHYYFICTVPDHCQAGQKVDIRVPPAGARSSPSPSPITTPSPSPIPAPQPSPIAGDSPAPIQPLPFPYPPPTPSPEISPAPAPEKTPARENSPAPILPKESPAPTTEGPAPDIAPTSAKSNARQLGIGMQSSTTLLPIVSPSKRHRRSVEVLFRERP
uniref:blue copper protein-like n=1 Tax=Erigeron canadensis TaxID=72917 RepID=UPI001CB9026D|nr:blue copper protein-like [Erigeron canadensis]